MFCANTREGDLHVKNAKAAASVNIDFAEKVQAVQRILFGKLCMFASSRALSDHLGVSLRRRRRKDSSFSMGGGTT